MIKIKAIFLLLAGVLMQLTGLAQNQVVMADVMRDNGKIYVVVIVCLIILAGLFIYLISLDRKISKIEKNKE